MEARESRQHSPRYGRVPGPAGLDELLDIEVGDLAQLCGYWLPVAAAQARAEDTSRQRPPKSAKALELNQCGHIHHAQSSLRGVCRERGLLQRCGRCRGAGRLLRRLKVFWCKCRLGD